MKQLLLWRADSGAQSAPPLSALQSNTSTHHHHHSIPSRQNDSQPPPATPPPAPPEKGPPPLPPPALRPTSRRAATTCTRWGTMGSCWRRRGWRTSSRRTGQSRWGAGLWGALLGCVGLFEGCVGGLVWLVRLAGWGCAPTSAHKSFCLHHNPPSRPGQPETKHRHSSSSASPPSWRAWRPTASRSSVASGSLATTPWSVAGATSWRARGRGSSAGGSSRRASPSRRGVRGLLRTAADCGGGLMASTYRHTCEASAPQKLNTCAASAPPSRLLFLSLPCVFPSPSLSFCPPRP
jgi:hypothetical protein